MSEIVATASSAFAELLPGGGLRAGTVVGLAGRTASTSLALGLLAASLTDGRWGAVVGWPELGAEAAHELGVPLDRLAIIPAPGPMWLDVVGALVDAVDFVVLRPTGRISASHARRIAVRVRERGCVVLVSSLAATHWPESFDTRFVARDAKWIGLGRAFGTLGERLVEIEVDGRRVPNRHRAQLLLPAANGGIASAPRTRTGSSESDDGDGFAITA